jgi:hypothetical protein
MGTKNNPKNRGGGVENKKFQNGKELEPVKYCGRHAGHGNYIAGRVVKSNDMICDASGKPLLWEEIASDA